MADLKHPLVPAQVGKLVRSILGSGLMTLSSHAQDEMEADGMIETDVVNTLRGGVCREPGEFEGGSCRYRLHTAKFCAVVAFRSDAELRVVTVWRKK